MLGELSSLNWRCLMVSEKGGGWSDAKGANHFSGENALVISRLNFSRPHFALHTSTSSHLRDILNQLLQQHFYPLFPVCLVQSLLSI